MEYVISENELGAAIEHLKRDPRSYAAHLPRNWTLKQLKDHILEALSEVKTPTIGTSVQVLYNVWAHLEPVGVDLMRYPRRSGQLQVMLSFRNEYTQPERLVVLRQD